MRKDLIESIVGQHTRANLMQNSMSMIQDMQKQLVETAQREEISSELDPQMADWIPSGSTYDSATPEMRRINLPHLRRMSRNAYYQNPHGRNIIRTLIKFTVGSGIMIDFAEQNEDAAKLIFDFWTKQKKRIKWTRFIREYVRRLLRDGEVIIRKFPQDGDLVLRFIEPDTIKDTDILSQDGDPANVVAYQIGRDKVDAGEVHFLKADVDENVPRGRPILEPILPYLTKYGKWLDARMILNIVRASVAVVQEVQGTSSDLYRIAGKSASVRQNTGQSKSRMLQPGTIIRGTPGVKYSMLSPNLDARDAAQDGRTILLAIAASAGFPDVYVTADYANANFASTVTAQNPAIREFEDWQVFISEGITEVIEWLLEDAVERQVLPSVVEDADGVRPVDLSFAIGFPPLLKRDVAQENAAYQGMSAEKVISHRTWAMRMGFNYDEEQKYIQQEEEKGQATPEPDALKKPPTAKKGPADRTPRQGNVGARIQSQKMAFVVKEERVDGKRKVMVFPVTEESETLAATS